MKYWILREEYDYDWDEQYTESFDTLAQCQDRYTDLTNFRNSSRQGRRVLLVFYGYPLSVNPDGAIMVAW